MEFINGIQEWFNKCKSINVIHDINRMKDKNHRRNSIDSEKAFDKIWHPFMIKILKKGYERNISQHTKNIYDKLIDNIILNSEMLKNFPLKEKEQDKDGHSHYSYST